MGIGFGVTLEFISHFAETDMTAVQMGLRNSQQCNAMNRYEQNISVGMSFFLPQKSSKFVHFLVFAMTMSTRGGFWTNRLLPRSFIRCHCTCSNLLKQYFKFQATGVAWVNGCQLRPFCHQPGFVSNLDHFQGTIHLPGATGWLV